MVVKLISFVIQYGNYFLAAGFLAYLARKGQLHRLRGISLYLACLITVDAIGRPYVLNSYGYDSQQYAYFYWLTDLVLVLCAFWVVCDFFRRATSNHTEMWRYFRWILVFTLILVLGVSGLSLSKNYAHFFSGFIVEFNQNLYFTCLVLNTLLYIMMQQIGSTDEELGLLVCGMGIEFAGPAASLALYHIISGTGVEFVRALTGFLIPACNLGMLMIWFYAVTQVAKEATSTAAGRNDSALAPVVAD
jgi:hypothetical protein